MLARNTLKEAMGFPTSNRRLCSVEVGEHNCQPRIIRMVQHHQRPWGIRELALFVGQRPDRFERNYRMLTLVLTCWSIVLEGKHDNGSIGRFVVQDKSTLVHHLCCVRQTLDARSESTLYDRNQASEVCFA